MFTLTDLMTGEPIVRKTSAKCPLNCALFHQCDSVSLITENAFNIDNSKLIIKPVVR